jgi:hypothetical protein
VAERLGTLLRRRELRQARRAADRELALSSYVPLRLAWRADEVTAAKNRMETARALRDAVRGSDPHYLPSASPLHRGAVRAEHQTIAVIVNRLEALDRAVAPRGVLLAERLLTDGASPLYAPEGGEELGDRLDEIVEALEPR